MSWIVKIKVGENHDFARDDNGNIKEFIGYASANEYANSCDHAVELVNRLTNAIFPIQKKGAGQLHPIFEGIVSNIWGVNHAK